MLPRLCLLTLVGHQECPRRRRTQHDGCLPDAGFEGCAALRWVERLLRLHVSCQRCCSTLPGLETACDAARVILCTPQFLKLGAAGALPGLSDYFLIWDMDMVPLRTLPLLTLQPNTVDVASTGGSRYQVPAGCCGDLRGVKQKGRCVLHVHVGHAARFARR